MERENKTEILNMLCETLKKTRKFSALASIEYVTEHGDEYAVGHFTNGYSTKINITADSGIAAIYDIVRGL